MTGFLVFPGQGSQAPGMGRGLATRFVAADVALDEASEAIGMDLRHLMWRSPADILTRTENAQPAIVAVGIAALRVWQSAESGPGDVAWASGHSVGAIAAAVACGALSPADGVRLARRRGEIMASAPGDGAMLAVAITSPAQLEHALATAADLELDTACFNGSRQVVLSGDAAAVRAARDHLGARAALLPVSHAFHSRLMTPVIPAWAAELASVTFAAPAVPYLSCRTGQTVVTADGVVEDLLRGLRDPVRWDLVSAQAEACGTGVVLGTGSALLRMWRGLEVARATTVIDDAYRGSARV